jgi:CRP/FNR family transcriptional regulator, anaerobic regulatory protein
MSQRVNQLKIAAGLYLVTGGERTCNRGNVMEASRAISSKQAEARRLAPSQPIYAKVLPLKAEAASVQPTCSCSACPARELNLCAAAGLKDASELGGKFGTPMLASTVHTIPARRMICHPKEWSEFVSVICDGWAAASVALPDGRQQILSFLLPGDFAPAASLFEAMSGHAVEALTEVTYRRFKRSEIRANLLVHSDLLDRIAKIWKEERTQADQLALDLGRRTADERIARLILNLADKLAKRGMTNGQTMQFPLRQRHIADATGLTPVHVSKVLGEFQRSGLVEIGGRSLTIVDAAELRRAADWR